MIPCNPMTTGRPEAPVIFRKRRSGAFVRQRYPEATIVALTHDDKGAEAELSCPGAKIKVRFDFRPQGYLWTESEWDLDIRDTSAVPASVRATLDASYADYRLNFLKYVETGIGRQLLRSRTEVRSDRNRPSR